MAYIHKQLVILQLLFFPQYPQICSDYRASLAWVVARGSEVASGAFWALPIL